MNQIFVGRVSEMQIINRMLDEYLIEGVGRVMNIFGEGGIGKSAFLSQILESAQEKDIHTVGPVDFIETINQDVMRFQMLIAGKLGEAVFPKFISKVNDSVKMSADEKTQAVQSSFLDFTEELKVFLESGNKVLIAFDTFEVVGDNVFQKLLELITVLQGKVCFILCGRQKIEIPKLEISQIKLDRFTKREVRELANSIFELNAEDFNLAEDEVVKIFELSNGMPIYASAAVDMILWRGKIDFDESDFLREVALFFTQNPKTPKENLAIMYMAILDKKFDVEIFKTIASISDEDAKNVLGKLKKLSFVRYLEDSDSFLLHDEMKDTFLNHMNIEEDDVNSARKRVVDEYYTPLTKVNQEQRLIMQSLFLDMIYYMIKYSPSEAFVLFVSQLENASKEYEIDYSKRLIDTIKNKKWDSYHISYINMLDGEVKLREYDSSGARDAFEKACSDQSFIESRELFTRTLEGLAKCTILGCETVGEDVQNALVYLNMGLGIAKKFAQWSQVASIQLNIGVTYHLMGKQNDAIICYKKAINSGMKVDDFRIAGLATDQLVFVLRRSGKVQDAYKWARKGFNLRKKLNDRLELAKSYHSLGVVYRDLKNSERKDQKKAINYQNKAIEYTNKAIEIYDEYHLQSELAQALKDLGWTYFALGIDHNKAKEYAQKSIDICDRFGFERIKGEALHTVFEVVDAANVKAGKDAIESLPILLAALELSRKNSGFFMTFDLLHHLTLIDKRFGNCDKIPLRIKEMEDYLERGIQFRYFLGRAINTWGDCAFEDMDFDLAFERYTRGYRELALGGDSGAFIAPYKKAIREDLPKIFDKLNESEQKIYAKKMVSYWEDNDLSNSFPEVVEVCKKYI